MFYRVQSVEPKDNFILSVLFTDGVKTEYDIKPLFTKWGVFNNLKTIEGLVRQVKVDAGGYGISWNDEIDLASEELRINGKRFVPEDEPTPDELQAIAEAKADTSPTVPHETINWD